MNKEVFVMTGDGPVDDERLKKIGTIGLRHAEIVRRVQGKSLNPDSVCEDLQLIIDGASGDPVERFLLQELRHHWRFFNLAFDLSKFAETLKRYLPESEKDYGWNNQAQKWKNLGFEIHFLPKIGIFSDAKPPGLQIMLPEEYFNLIQGGHMLRKDKDGIISLVQSGLERVTVLIDTCQMPLEFYSSSRPSYESPFKNDISVGKVVQKLREDVKIEYIDGIAINSRFCVSFTEWQREVRPALAKKLEVNPSMIRLETVLERYVIPQLYPHLSRQSDFKSKAGVWCEEQEKCGDQFFANVDGLNRLSTASQDAHMIGVAFRPIVVLD